MLELFWAAVAPVNLPYTVLLGLVVVYWLMYVLGFLGSEALDAFDIDLDLNGNSDVDADVDAGGISGWLVASLRFIHIGSVPVLLIFSILILSMWTLSISANHLLANSNGWIALGLFFPNFILSLIITKAVLTPFVPLLKQLFDQKSDKMEIIGKPCKVTSMEVTSKYGQAEIATAGAPVLLNVVSREGVTLKKGEEAVVYAHDENRDAYLIAPLGLDQQQDLEK